MVRVKWVKDSTVPGHTVSAEHTLAAVTSLPCSLIMFCLVVWLEFLECTCMFCVCAPTSGSRVWEQYLAPGVFYFRCGSTTRAGTPSALSWMSSTMLFSGPTCRRERTLASMGLLPSITPWTSPSSSSRKWLCKYHCVWIGRGRGCLGESWSRGRKYKAGCRVTAGETGSLWCVWVGTGSGQKMISLWIGWAGIKLQKIHDSDILKTLLHLLNSHKVS